MSEIPPKPKYKPTGELGLPPIPDKPMPSEMKDKLDAWTAGEQAKAKTPEEQADVFVRRARILSAAGFYDAANKAYGVANDIAMANGLYELNGKLTSEVLGMEGERAKKDNETRTAQKNEGK